MAQDGNSENLDPPTLESTTTRPVGGTEFSWCKAVPGGTGTTVLSLLLSKPPQIPLVQNALHKLQNSHPILRSKIHLNHSPNTFHFVTPPNPASKSNPSISNQRPRSLNANPTLVAGGGGGEVKEEKVNSAIEDLIPDGKTNKPFWARGLDVLGYSLNALRFANLSFVDANSPRSSRIVRMQLNADETKNLLA
ncbi:hypothetical protein SESBI_50530, partial [Sesbania bispinosa]